jgi:phage recombination protein Bet
MRAHAASAGDADLGRCVADGSMGLKANTTLSEVIDRAVAKSGMSYGTFVRCVTQNAFRSLVVWSEADMERLLLTCEALGLSPVGRDVYAAQPESGAGVLIAVGVDGWSRIVNQHPQYDGMEFEESPELEGGVPVWIRCTIHRRDRRFSMSVKEYLCEAVRDTGAWQTHPRRMLRHKAMVQCARLAFELPTISGVYDIDEAERIAQVKVQVKAHVKANLKAQASAQSGAASSVQHLNRNASARKNDQPSEVKIDGGAAQGNSVSEGATEKSDDATNSPEDPNYSTATGNEGLCKGQRNANNCKTNLTTMPRKRRGPSSTQQLVGALTR